jgi:transposase
MEVTHSRCCGLDVHKRTVVACVLTAQARETRTFGTNTTDLLALGDWLQEKDVKDVAMESTGVYWKPVYNLLEELDFKLVVVNAEQIKKVAGRKTDVKDAEWIADLFRHGLLRSSYIPDRPQRELRELVRHRRSLIRQRVQIVNRIQKVLEGANIKLSSVASDVVGVSGRAMVEAMISGEQDPKVLADLARGRLREKQERLEAALRGLVGPHQRWMLDSLLRQLDFVDEETDRANVEIEMRMRPFEQALQRIDSIPGIGRRSAEDLLGEIGQDMSPWPSAAHLASWARVCPTKTESAGRNVSGRTLKGNPWLKAALVESAWAASHTKNTYLSAQYRRLAARRGRKKALLALAHTILVIIYALITKGGEYDDLGGNYFDERTRGATLRRSIKRIERLGYKVTVEAA